MFAYKRFLIGFLTLLLVGVTFLIAWTLEIAHDKSFWYTLSSIWLSEVLLGLSCAEFMKTDERSAPVLFGNFSIALFYFIFTLISIFIFTGNVSAAALLTIHVVALFIVVALQIFFGMAHNAAQTNDKAEKKALLSKKIFAQKLMTFKMQNAEMLTADEELNKKFAKLQEIVKFASESISGSEDIDARINDQFDQFIEATTVADADSIADKLLSSLKYRTEFIKTLR